MTANGNGFTYNLPLSYTANLALPMGKKDMTGRYLDLFCMQSRCISSQPRGMQYAKTKSHMCFEGAIHCRRLVQSLNLVVIAMLSR